MQELLKGVLKDIESTQAIIRDIEDQMRRTRNTAKFLALQERLRVATDMLEELHRQSAEIQNYLRK